MRGRKAFGPHETELENNKTISTHISIVRGSDFLGCLCDNKDLFTELVWELLWVVNSRGNIVRIKYSTDLHPLPFLGWSLARIHVGQIFK